ncbi:hypothetical protein [Mastigocoleus testarum]|uniref:hypothetical protein n=1 Tax=Mastigocoleus testarum TaxID=996925 RepID=UPI00137A306E|nr:hypothetical protein [Mastigocoleus testarum]
MTLVRGFADAVGSSGALAQVAGGTQCYPQSPIPSRQYPIPSRQPLIPSRQPLIPNPQIQPS